MAKDFEQEDPTLRRVGALWGREEKANTSPGVNLNAFDYFSSPEDYSGSDGGVWIHSDGLSRPQCVWAPDRKDQKGAKKGDTLSESEAGNVVEESANTNEVRIKYETAPTFESGVKEEPMPAKEKMERNDKDEMAKEEKIERRVKLMKKGEIKAQLEKGESSPDRGIETQTVKKEEKRTSRESPNGKPGVGSELGHSWYDGSDATTELGTGAGE